MPIFDLSNDLNALEDGIQHAQKREGAVHDEMRQNQRNMKEAVAELAPRRFLRN